MDTQKLGRALGYGTRHAAKTLAAVAEAAAAPDPRRPAPSPPAATPLPPPPATTPRPARTSTGGSASGFWAPLATFSSALWLRVTGLFFGLLAMSLGTGAWRLRHVAGSGGTPEQRHHFWIFLLFALLFSYFAGSSFVRATLRERRDARR